MNFSQKLKSTSLLWCWENQQQISFYCSYFFVCSCVMNLKLLLVKRELFKIVQKIALKIHKSWKHFCESLKNLLKSDLLRCSREAHKESFPYRSTLRMKICIKAKEKSNCWQLQGARKISILQNLAGPGSVSEAICREMNSSNLPFFSVETFLLSFDPQFVPLRLTLNNEKSALISLLDDCDEFVAIDDIGDSDSSSILQMSSSLVAFAVLVVGGSTANTNRNENHEN